MSTTSLTTRLFLVHSSCFGDFQYHQTYHCGFYSVKGKYTYRRKWCKNNVTKRLYWSTFYEGLNERSSSSRVTNCSYASQQPLRPTCPRPLMARERYLPQTACRICDVIVRVPSGSQWGNTTNGSLSCAPSFWKSNPKKMRNSLAQGDSRTWELSCAHMVGPPLRRSSGWWVNKCIWWANCIWKFESWKRVSGQEV